MAWPQATDYNAAVQNPALCFADAELREGVVATNVLGLPLSHAGTFGDVYQVTDPSGASWAVKCFTRPAAGLRERYQAISEHLGRQPRRFMVDFCYLEEGIKVHGQFYPALKMKWVEGLRLNEFLAQHADKPAVLERLAQMWQRLAWELREAGMAHGDLQHGNVLLVPGSRAASLALRLIDYDGLWVPALADRPSGEVGHPHYQHPQRLAGGLYSAEMDRFSHLVIYTALRCLRAGGPSLWQRYDNGENLLFREEDFRRPVASRLWPELWALRDPDARALAGHLLLAGLGPASAVPLLDQLLSDGGVLPLSADDEALVRSLLPPETLLRRPRSASATATLVMPAQEVIPPLPGPLATTGPDLPVPPPDALHPLPDFLRGTAVLTAPPKLPPSRASSRVVEVEPKVWPRTPSAPPPLPAKGPPVTPRSLRSYLTLLSAAAAATVLLLGGLAWVLWPAPPPLGPRLLLREPVVLRGGQTTTIEVAIERNGFVGPLTVGMEDLPPGVHQESELTLQAGEDTGHLHLHADRDAEGVPCGVQVVLRAAGRTVYTSRLEVTVHKFLPPVLGALPVVRVRPWPPQLVRIPVDRNGYMGPLTLRLESLPAGMTQEPISLPDRESAVAVRIRIEPSAAPGLHRVQALLLADGLATTNTPPMLSIQVETPPIESAKRPQLKGEHSLHIAVGKTEKVTVILDRQGYAGPVEVGPKELPRGITLTKSTIPAGAMETALQLQAGPNLAPGSYQVKVLAWVDGKPVDEKAWTIEVEATAAAAPPAPQVPARPGHGETVKIVTADDVELRGVLYPGRRGKDGACVLLLHDVGRGHQGSDMEPLAHVLNNAGHTVLQLDLRGHGGDSTVQPAFWGFQANKLLTRFHGPDQTGKREQIGVKNFPPSYYPWLVQDLAAARSFLELRHDDRTSPVNADHLVVIGAGEAAALTALFLAEESFRYRVLDSGNPFDLATFAPEPEVASVAGAFFLSAVPTLEKQPMPVAEWLILTGRQHTLPLIFVYGLEDDAGAVRSHQLLEAVKGGSKIHPRTRLLGVANTREAGERLLQPGLGANKVVLDAIEELLRDRSGRRWEPRSFQKNTYSWCFPDSFPKIAKKSDTQTLLPIPVEQFGVR
jgi:hypothetical protein